MGWLIEWAKREPVRAARAVRLILSALPAFGYVITEDQYMLIASAVTFLLGERVTTEFARSKVTPMAKVRKVAPAVADALE